MKILIIEDKAQHIASAQKFAQESGHVVTIVTNYNAAETALCGPSDRFGRNKFETNYDVVLTDLFLPASMEGLMFPKPWEDMPYGVTLMLLAMRSGVKKIALLTDGNHHAHPFIWALDPLGGSDTQSFTIGDVKVLCVSDSFIYKEQQYCNKKNVEVEANNPLIGAKAWPALLEKLLSE